MNITNYGWSISPDSWTLVVPIDHTKDELTWFDGLRSRYPFPLIWNSPSTNPLGRLVRRA
jgi:hypothetical protein